MDPTRFDALARALSAAPTRRAALAALLGAGLAGVARVAAVPKRQRHEAPSTAGTHRGSGAGRDVGAAACHRLGKRCDRKRGDVCCGHARCAGGMCKCPGKKKPCHGRCIPETDCCDSADCGGGATCQGGHCLCPDGEKDCDGRCIPEDDCCTQDDCGACESCQRGQCVSGCQPGQECQGGRCTCSADSCDGCCDGDECEPGDSDAACGTGGDACAECGSHADCLGGTCQCDDGFKPCQGGCIADDACCGGCGTCQVCQGGTCVVASDGTACAGGRCCGGTCRAGAECCADGDCGAGQVCAGGTCAVSCSDPTDSCDTLGNPAGCGSCVRLIGGGLVCITEPTNCVVTDCTDCGPGMVCVIGSCACPGCQVCGTPCGT